MEPARIVRRLSWSPVELASRKARSLSGVVNFASGSPDPLMIPVREIMEALEQTLLEYGASALGYPGAGGLPELVEELKLYIRSDLGIGLRDDEDLVVTSGAQHGIKLLSQLLLGSGDVVVTEDPSFWEAIDPMRFQGARIVGVGISENGMDTHALEKILRRGLRPRIVYTIPTCHNPCGVTMDLEGRKHLVELAEEYGFLILEDDPYRPIARNPPPSIKDLDKGGRVIYVGTMSKVLAPGLRIGFAVMNRELAEELSKLEQHDFSTSTIIQLAVARILRRGVVKSLLPKLRRHYEDKLKTLIEALSEKFPERYIEPDCGFYTLLRLGKDAEEHLPRAIENGVIYVPARDFYIENKSIDAARISISTPPREKIAEGVERLKRSLETLS